MGKPRTVEITVCEVRNGSDWPSEKSTEFWSWFAKKLISIPAEFSRNATIEISAEDHWGSCSPHITIKYERPETEEERLARRKAEALQIGEKVQAERDLLEKLKSKYDKGR